MTAQNTEAQQKTTAQGQQTTQGVGRVSTPLQSIAGPARFINGLIQRIPSNRFINVEGPKRSLGQFIEVINTITGHSDQHGEQQQAANTVISARTTAVQQGDQARARNTTGTQTLAQKVASDAAATQAASQNATTQAGASQQAEQTLQQKMAQKQQERQRRMAALSAWAAQHKAMRESASSR